MIKIRLLIFVFLLLTSFAQAQFIKNIEFRAGPNYNKRWSVSDLENNKFGFSSDYSLMLSFKMGVNYRFQIGVNRVGLYNNYGYTFGNAIYSNLNLKTTGYNLSAQTYLYTIPILFIYQIDKKNRFNVIFGTSFISFYTYGITKYDIFYQNGSNEKIYEETTFFSDRLHFTDFHFTFGLSAVLFKINSFQVKTYLLGKHTIYVYKNDMMNDVILIKRLAYVFKLGIAYNFKQTNK